MPRSAHELAAELNAQRSAFKSFLAARVGSDADDILQNSLIKALQHADTLTAPGHATAWFYRVLRNAVIDHYRARGSARQRDEALGTLLNALAEDVEAAPEWAAQLCGCLGSVMASLPARSAELLRRVDLEGESVQAVAAAMQLTANNASVILHRARAQLRDKLVVFCGACADGACLDCHCEKTDGGL